MAWLDNFWNVKAEEACKALDCTDKGLSGAEAAARLEKYGANILKPPSKASAFLLFLLQFKSPITLLLIAAALLSFALGDLTDAVIILFIILVSSLLGFWQEKGAVHAVEELLKMVRITCRVIRDGRQNELAVEKVVPGDIVLLSVGDMIPADCLLLDSNELFIDEAAFTGETFPMEKNTGVISGEVQLSKRSNSLFMGSHVVSGKAKALVIKTGKQTEFGKITAALGQTHDETDFEKGIRRFGYLLMIITLVLVILIFAINVILNKPPLESFLFSLALAVGLTPQLLPAIISVNLSAGARTMATQQVIVKKLSSIENFGSMNMLCSDKTGTITEGKVALSDALDIQGIHSDKTLHYAWLNASLQQGFNNPIDEAIKLGYQGKAGEFDVQSEIPYDFLRKRLSIQLRNEQQNIVITKGSFDSIVDICDRAETADGSLIKIDEKISDINASYVKLSNAGFRVLGIAYTTGTNDRKFTRGDEKDMIFLGIISLFDPPKKDMQQTVINLQNLGVQLKLITGDNALVAAHLAAAIGIPEPVILTGKQINEMSDTALLQKAGKTHVFAEIEPNQKAHIVSCLRRAGNVVGFIGDGINDAPALHAADVGISVDSAVDVAKEAADIILLNKDLNVLITGIIAGRKTFVNTMKYIFMATSANFGTMFSMAGASLFLPFLPMLPKQVLLNNLLTDFPEMTIATDKVDAVAVDKPPRWNIKFIQRFMIVFGLLSSVFDYMTFGLLLFLMKENEKVFQTGWFVESVISQVLIVLVVRTRLPFYKSLPGKYLLVTTGIMLIFVLALPFMPFARFLGFVRLPYSYYGWLLLIVAGYISAAEVAKIFFYRRLENSGS